MCCKELRLCQIAIDDTLQCCGTPSIVVTDYSHLWSSVTVIIISNGILPGGLSEKNN